MAAFNCIRCGSCCMDTIATAAGGELLGLYLEPDEIGRFPPDIVYPLLGTGGTVAAITVTAYQLGVNRCPHFSMQAGVGTCGIYAQRPLTCAAFPVIGRASVNARCRAVQAAGGGIDADSMGPELAAHNAKLLRMLARAPDKWIWPLNKKCWVPFAALA